MTTRVSGTCCCPHSSASSCCFTPPPQGARVALNTAHAHMGLSGNAAGGIVSLRAGSPLVPEPAKDLGKYPSLDDSPDHTPNTSHMFLLAAPVWT